MIQMDRQLLTMIAAIVCVAACIYLFKEMKQAKDDVDGLKMVQTKMMHMLTPPPQPRPFGMPTSPPPPPPPAMPKQKHSTVDSAPEIDESVDDIAEEK
jgi:hypothetical protein